MMDDKNYIQVSTADNSNSFVHKSLSSGTLGLFFRAVGATGAIYAMNGKMV